MKHAVTLYIERDTITGGHDPDLLRVGCIQIPIEDTSQGFDAALTTLLDVILINGVCAQ